MFNEDNLSVPIVFLHFPPIIMPKFLNARGLHDPCKSITGPLDRMDFKPRNRTQDRCFFGHVCTSHRKTLPVMVGLLPVIAVLIGIYGFSNAYLSVAIYHGGILLLLWPFMHLPDMTFAGLLEGWGMQEAPIVLFCFYSILIHPSLEEAFWRGLMPANLLSDALFALFVLVKVVHGPFALLCFSCLAVAGFAWRWIAQKNGVLLIPIVSHAVADLGVLLAVWYLT
jgi:membrane protease YdiL (CAAX protease family)